MSKLNDEIYPALFERLREVMPEFEFIRTSNGYESNTTQKLSGEQGGSKRKVYVLERTPFWIGDNRETGQSIWNYIQERDSIVGKRNVFLRLAELANVILNDQDLSPEALERIERSRRLADLWETANDFFIDCLSGEANPHALTSTAERIRDYLTNPLEKGGRGYNPGLFRFAGQDHNKSIPKMELGYMPGFIPLEDHLTAKGFTADEVAQLFESIQKSGDRIGKVNVLSFPYRDHTGRIRGMVFRSTEKNDKIKYLYSSFQRGEVLFNLKAVSKDKDLVIVESPLDAMHAAALGVFNITALGGSSLNKMQIDLAIKYGANRITLLLDNDSQDGVDGAGVKGTDRALTLLQKDYPDLRVYVGQYPDATKDLDELLIKQGVDGFYQIKADALDAWRYQLDRLFTIYERQQPENGYLTDKQRGNLLDDILSLASKLNPIDKDSLINAFVSDPGVQALGITSQTITETVDSIRGAEFKKKQVESTQSLLRDARKLLESGEPSQALDLLKEQSKEISSHDKRDSFAKFRAISTEQQLMTRIRNRPDPLQSGFTLANEPLLIPAAAITIAAGATSHGKSVLLANLAINLANQYPDKTFHLFSYEVDEERYIINLLNTYIGDEDLAFNNRESIEHYFRGKDKVHRKGYDYSLFKPDKDKVFHAERVRFFSDLIDSGRIKVHYVTDDSDTLIEAVRYLNKTEPLGAVLVDYFQLIYTPVGKMRNPSRQEEIKRMCLDFKDLAIETGLPLIFGAQFNREVNNLTQMHATKLGEAGDLERISDLILGIWNLGRKSSGKLSKAEEETIIDRVGSLSTNPRAWYVEVLKRRGGKVESFDIWRYLGNAAKVSSDNNQQPF